MTTAGVKILNLNHDCHYLPITLQGLSYVTAVDVKGYLHIENTQNTCSGHHGFGAGDVSLF